jgi:ATP-binding cassette subfamily B protein
MGSRRSTFIALLKLCATEWRRMTVATIFLLAAVATNLAFPLLIRQTLNAAPNFFDFGVARNLCYAIATLFFLQACFFFARSYLFMVASHAIVNRLRVTLFHSLLERNLTFFEKERSGDLLARISSDTGMLQSAIGSQLNVCIRYGLQVFIGAVMMVGISPLLSVALFLASPLVVAIGMVLGRLLKRTSKAVQAHIGGALIVAEESLNAIRTVKSFNAEAQLLLRFGKEIQAALQTGIQRSKISAFFQSFVSFLINVSVLGVALYGVYLVNHGTLSLGDLLGFILYGLIVAVSFAFLASAYPELLQSLGALERIQDIMPEGLSVETQLDPLPKSALKNNREKIGSEVVFSDVSFRYPSRPDKLVLDHINFRIARGERIAIVGPSGAGKSTITQLVTALQFPTDGAVIIDGTPTNNWDPKELRARCAVVSQEAELFSFSIRDNVLLGKPTASDTELAAACRAAHIYDFIAGLPQGLDTPLGQRGYSLSGGQRQRVAIARALLRNPSILILDEATSALDSENEALIHAAIRDSMQGRTVLIIAHRLATVQDADRVFVLDRSHIIQTGTHAELRSEPGLYRQLVEQQMLA